MPELPEVETVARALRKKILGIKIKGAVATAPQLFQEKKLFRNIGRALRGDKFSAIGRHGKYLIFRLKSGRAMIAHMKMTGHFLVFNPIGRPIGLKAAAEDQRNNHIRFSIEFADRTKLLFSDVRKFGRIWLLTPDKIAKFFTDRKLAHDALSREASEAYLHTQLARNRAVKSLLLDQATIAGIGNIYADEILWAAKIHPMRKGTSLRETGVKKIYRAIGYILKLGIKAGGSSIRDYRHPDGSKGYFQTLRRVYQRESEPCPRCKTLIERIVVAQRGTHYCPKCQELQSP